MSLPNGWEWLDEVPSGWSPPAELRVPTGLPGVDLTIKMLSSNALGNDLIDLVGQLLSEGARFSMWFGKEAKVNVNSPKELALLSLTSGEQLRQVYEAWTSFIEAYRATGGKAGTFESEEDDLRVALIGAVRTLAETRDRFDGI